ncbi:MAG: beta-lactamase family protein [Acidobacteria bacterium]|nr:beta-lactamase family protein [Acidobacteriota bacterium]
MLKALLAMAGVMTLAMALHDGLRAQAPAPRADMPPVDPVRANLDPERLTAATALLRRFVDEGTVAGAVAAVSRRGTLGYFEAVGVQDLATRTPMRADTLFRIYSMTKPITAVAVMMLHERGAFRLDDPVQQYLPQFADVRVSEGETLRAPSRPITVRDLLLHTSGLSHRTSELYRTRAVRSRADTLPQFITKIVQAPLMEDPGTRFRYSEATTVLGRLIEVWTKQPFDAFLSREVLTPLKMSATRFWVPADARARLATVYTNAAGGLEPVEIETVPFTERPALLEGAVGLVSTVPDFLRFAQMLLNGGELDGVRLLKAETAREIVQNGLTPAQLATRGGGMGWGLANVSVVPAGGEYGWDGTAGTIFWNDPVSGTAIVLMTQSSPANPGRIREGFKAAVQAAVR